METLSKGVLADWTATIGVVMAFETRSAIATIAAMWLPTVTFFAVGFEHSMGDWRVWNQIPVTIGNILGGA